VGHYLGNVDITNITAGMVTVMVRIDDVPDRQVAYLSDKLLDLFKVLGKFVVDQDNAFRGNPDTHVTAGAGDTVETVFNELDGETILSASGTEQTPGHEQADENSYRHDYSSCWFLLSEGSVWNCLDNTRLAYSSNRLLSTALLA
jgi:hypothetical protein